MSDLRAIIVGAGIAGPVAAVALQKAGIEVEVHEAYGERAVEVGAFLGLGVNGIDALRAVDMDGPIVAAGFPTPRMVITNRRGRVLADLPNGEAAPDGRQGITIGRPALCAALREQAEARGIPTRYDKRLVDVADSGDAVVARFSDGTTAEGDLLIGADGIRSVVRRIVDPSAPDPSYVGFLNTAGYARGVDLGTEPGVTHLAFGRRAFFGYVQHPDGTVWWFANPPSAVEPDPVRLRAVPAQRWRQQLTELFADDDIPAVAAIDATDEIFPGWVTYDLPRVDRWYRGRTIIIGDAAHAVSPSAGQGASMAIEDAVILARCLRDAATIEDAFTRYDALRRERVDRVVAQGRRNGSGKTPGPLGRVLRDATMPYMMRWLCRDGRDPLRWMWDHHIDWDERTPSIAGHG